ncbi:MAG: YihY/virulence factor BrkB family protein [Actinobacteria bacterium]|nr:YihY/virulence factor BrkB family protein [Actinomycetota bacterium]
MSLARRLADKLNRTQQQHLPLAVAFGVVKKFGDDNAGTLVANLAHTAFGTMFPLLLLLVTVLGLVLNGHPHLRHEVLTSALSKFPVIGTDLAGNIKAMSRDSVFGFVVGIGGLVWGSLSLGQTGIFTMAQVWNLPGTERPNFAARLGRSLTFLAVLGVGLILGTFLGAAVPAAKGALALAVAGGAASGVVNFLDYLVGFRILTPAAIKLRHLVPGAALAAIGWTLLQSFGGFVVGHYLKNDNSLYGTFGIVLGLFAWIYLVCELTVYSAELNVVLSRRLFPRSLVHPPLTEADRSCLAAQALQTRQRPEQHVQVCFDNDVASTKV